MLDYEELLALASKKARRGSASRLLSKIKEKVRVRLATHHFCSIPPCRPLESAVVTPSRTIGGPSGPLSGAVLDKYSRPFCFCEPTRKGEEMNFAWR